MRRDLDFWRDPFEKDLAFTGFDRLLESFFTPSKRFSSVSEMKKTFLTPATDWEETDTHYVFTMDMPGLTKDDLKIELNENVLTVTGERKMETAKNKEYRERFYGGFQRSFSLPSAVDAEKVEAQYENGVLRVAVPKAESKKTKQIKVGEVKTGFLSRFLSGKKEDRPTVSEEKH